MKFLKRLRLVFFVLLLGVAAAGAFYLVTNSQQAQNERATAVAEKATLQAERDAAIANLEQVRDQQEAAAAAPTATPIVMTVPVPGPTQIVVQTSSEYSYVPTITTEASPSHSRIRYSVVLPPGTKAEDLAFRLEGGSDQPIGTQAKTIDAEPWQYYTAYIVKKTDAGNGAVLGSTGQFQAPGDNTVIIVFTFVPENPNP
jgi:type II secretory pathway pseudopilin PulG